MTCQADSIPGHQNMQETRLPSDQQDQNKERYAAVEEGVAMTTNTQQPDIQVREDRTQIARHKGREKNADGLTDIGPIARARRHIAHEQQDADQTVFGPVGALLPEEAEYRPVERQGHAEGYGKCDQYADKLFPLGHLHAVWGSYPTLTTRFFAVSDTVDVQP